MTLLTSATVVEYQNGHSAETNSFTLVALHGNGGGGFRFARMQPFVQDNISFWPITLPGFANMPPNASLTTMTDYGDHLAKVLSLVDGPCILLGTGIGGTFALELVQRHAQMVDGMILHAPVGTRLDTRLFPRLMKKPFVSQLGKRLLTNRLLRPLWKRLLFQGDLPPEYANQFFEEYRSCRVFSQMFDIISAEWFASLTESQTPTAFLWGEKERVLSVDQLNDYKRLLPNHIVKTVPEWDHFPMIEQPASYTHEVMLLCEQLLLMRSHQPNLNGHHALTKPIFSSSD